MEREGRFSLSLAHFAVFITLVLYTSKHQWETRAEPQPKSALTCCQIINEKLFKISFFFPFVGQEGLCLNPLHWSQHKTPTGQTGISDIVWGGTTGEGKEAVPLQEPGPCHPYAQPVCAPSHLLPFIPAVMACACTLTCGLAKDCVPACLLQVVCWIPGTDPLPRNNMHNHGTQVGTTHRAPHAQESWRAGWGGKWGQTALWKACGATLKEEI